MYLYDLSFYVLNSFDSSLRVAIGVCSHLLPKPFGFEIRMKGQHNFLTPSGYSTYFQNLREGKIQKYQSDLDVKLLEK